MSRVTLFLVLVLFVSGCSLAPATLARAPRRISREQFDQLTAGSGAKYLPYTGSGAHYELVGIGVVWGNVSNRIRVSVYDQAGMPAFNVWVRHSFGGGCPDDCERFAFTGEAVQFNLGGGSHYSEPADPPDRIAIEGLPSDEVHVGNCDCIAFAHTDWQMAFRLVDAINPTPPAPTRTLVPTSTPGADATRCDLLPISGVRICAP